MFTNFKQLQNSFYSNNAIKLRAVVLIKLQTFIFFSSTESVMY